MKFKDLTLDTIVTLAKHRGFIFPGSEIYGGLSNSWDYGPLGVLLKNNVRDAWWKFFVQERGDIIGLDAAILMNPKVWEASGHVSNFNDPLVDCKKCKSRFRADHLIEEADASLDVSKMTLSDMSAFIHEKKIACPKCGEKDFTDVRKFNLLFETSLGTVEGQKQTVYLRGELAQGMFVDFKRIVDSMHIKLPFGIAQVGRVFRNEITPGNFTFRTLEFDLMEFEYFIKPEEWKEKFDYWLAEMQRWLESIGISKEATRVREHSSEELSHYSQRTVDIEYLTPFGWKELCGFAYRTDFDLKNHSEKSGQDLSMIDSANGQKFIPHVLEPTFGLTRHVLFLMLECYDEEEVKGEKRVVMRFPARLAPYQVAVLPLSKKPELAAISQPLAQKLRQSFSTDYDETQSIGKRYRRQDEIGTPYCVTVDFETINDNAVTIRDRDSMQQERIALDKVEEYLKQKIQP